MSSSSMKNKSGGGKKEGGGMINPHNPEFLTKKPWYLASGSDEITDSTPTLQHQGIQKETATELSLSKAEELLEQQRLKQAASRGSDVSSTANANAKFQLHQWVEGLKKSQLPYQICQIVKVHKNNTYDVQYEDGRVETHVKNKPSSARPRLRHTQSGNRVDTQGYTETYDSKRDAYHGYNRHAHNAQLVQKYEQKLAMRRQLREQQQKQQKGSHPDDKDRDDDDDEFSTDDSDRDDDDEFVQNDADAKVLTTRLARQGGVGGAQMKVTARNLRIREDTAKYLRNLDPNSAYYDPKSRSMRDNPNPELPETDFAGDNFARISGDAVHLAQQQLFAWEASNRGVQEVHPQANPSQAEYLQKQFESSAKTLQSQKKQSVLDKYGGQEYLQDHIEKLGDADAKLRFGESTTVSNYNLDGTTKAPGHSAKKQPYRALPCKYEEDIFINGHTTVWGSYFHLGAFTWGYQDDHSLLKMSYCTGETGRFANDEANLRLHGTGVLGSAALAQARSLVSKPPQQHPPPPKRSHLYGEADPALPLDDAKVQQAVRELQQAGRNPKKAKTYHSNYGEEEMTAEMMEAYRLTKSNANDPMAIVGSDTLVEYDK